VTALERYAVCLVDVESVLAAPVGRLLLAALAARGGTPDTALEGLGEDELYHEVVDAALSLSARGVTAEHNGWDDEAAGIPSAKLAALSSALLHAPITRWWSTVWHARPQLWVGPPTQAPVLRAAGDGDPPPGKPPAVLWTSSRLASGMSAWWPVVTSGLLGAATSWSTWRVDLSPRAEVYEIRSASDWARLCTEFALPGSAGDLNPDWTRVAERFDGVHLTVEGLICAQGVAVDGAAGRARLWGWDAEATAWLRWCVDGVDFEGTLAVPPSS